MNSVTVDELVMRIEVELDKFRAQAGEAENIDKRLRKSLKDTEKSTKDTGGGFVKLGDDVQASNKALTSKLKTLATVTTRLVGFFGVLAGSNAVNRFATGIAKANDNLNFMAQRLGMSSRNIKGLDTAVAALGGSGAGAMATIASLNQGIQEMVIMGNDTLIPFFGALGVGVTDAQGNIRNMDAILLDMSDSFSKMDPQKAYAMASAMGLDEGVANALIQGRDAMQEMIDLQASMYVSTQAELRASRELNKAQALLSAKWEGLKTIIGNAVIPMLLKMTNVVSGWLDYLNRNDRTVKNFFEGMSIAIGVVLIPMLLKGAVAMLAFMAPFLATTLAVGALAAAFGLLYDDYKTWAAGGKSLFDWGGFIKYFTDAEISVDNLKSGFARLLTGYNSWAEASKGFKDWLKEKGLIDGNRFAIENLGTAFKNLGKDILAASPLLQAVAETIGLLLEGKFIEAAKRAADIPGLMIRGGYDLSAAAIERVSGAVDRTLGHDPDKKGSLTSYLSSAFDAGSNWLSDFFGIGRSRGAASTGDALEDKFAAAEKAAGLPEGMMSAVFQQETGSSMEYVDDPGKYHYALNAEGKRIAPHTGKVSTARGPFGILESTAKDPGWGVSPLTDFDNFDEHIRFMSEYLAARIKSAGSVEAGLAGYGEGVGYAKSVEKRRIEALKRRQAVSANPTTVSGLITGAQAARAMSAGSLPAASSMQQVGRTLEVNVGQVTVQTSANTLPAATAEGVKAGVQQGLGLAEQLAGGLQ